MQINRCYLDLKDSYLFATIAKKVNAYQGANPNAKIIRLGIGDVTLPLCKEVITALHEAVEEMSVKENQPASG